MKKLIPLLILLGGAVSGFAQGTVTFQNVVQFQKNAVTGVQTNDVTGGQHDVYDVGSPLSTTTGVRLAGTQYVAELYAGADAGSLTAIPASISRFRGTTSANIGKWAVSTVNGVPNDPTAIPGFVAGQTVTLMVKVWDYNANGGAAGSFETANIGPKGSSDAFLYKIAAPGDPPGNFYMENMQSFALVPEPSAIALSVLGVAGLLFVRRRK